MAGGGFDFGIELRALLVSDVSFIEFLNQAKIVACAYGYVPRGPLGVPMWEISLVGENSEPLTKAFVEFRRWAASGDGDAVELTFIFLKDGGYLLWISREHGRALRDLQGSGRTYSPILVGATYNKKFDTRQKAIEEFREYKSRQLISPFLFGAASIKLRAGAVPALDQVEPLIDIEPILKFEAEFLDENTIQPGTSHYLLLTMLDQSRSSGGKKPAPSLPSLPKPSQQPEDHFRYRARILERHFPVTIERIRAGRYPETMSALREQGVKDWQFEQAVANLLLSSSLCNGQLFYSNAPTEELAKRVAQAIQQREERSDTPELTRFSTNDIITQVRLDAVALLLVEGHSVSVSLGLDSLQKRLASLNLLEPPSA